MGHLVAGTGSDDAGGAGVSEEIQQPRTLDVERVDQRPDELPVRHLLGEQPHVFEGVGRTWKVAPPWPSVHAGSAPRAFLGAAREGLSGPRGRTP